MNRLERRGFNNLTCKRPARSPRVTSVVRIYYRSQGGELLCCDSEPLTNQSANNLRMQLTGQLDEDTPRPDCPTDVIKVEIVPLDKRFRHLPKHGARWVELPSQVPETRGQLTFDEHARPWERVDAERTG